MSRKLAFSLAAALVATTSGLYPGLAQAADTDTPELSSIVHRYDAPDGDTYFSLSLHAEFLPAAPLAHDHVILVDTSASQIGEHRTRALNVVREMLSALPSNDRVSLFAVDLEANPMTDGLVTPRAALEQALPQLTRRFPAGATDLPGALHTALQQLDRTRPASIIYIGDGMSAARILQTSELRTIAAELRSQRIPVHSFAVGSNTDLELLGILAQQTGGVVLLDETGAGEQDAAAIGRRLARSADLPVYYPRSMTFNSSDVSILPSEPLPMRADRSTVYLGRGDLNHRRTVSVAVDVNGVNRTISGSLPPATDRQGTTFLGELWRRAEQNGGLGNPLAGDQLLATARQTFEDYLAAMEQEAQRALTAGDSETAARIGVALRQADPMNTRAASFINAGDEVRATTVAQTDSVDAAVQEAAEEGSALQDREQEPDQTPIDVAEQLRRIRTQRLQVEVEGAIDDARAILDEDPETAENVLEEVLGNVKGADDVEPEAQARMIRVLTAALNDTRSRKEVITTRQDLALKEASEAEAQARLLDSVIQREQLTQERVDRVSSLIYEGFQGNPNAFEQAEAVARIIFDMAPEEATGSQTVFTTEAAGQVDKALRLRFLRYDRWLATLYEVERSHVPFPDEPPIRYPPAEVWQQLTEQRRKWKSVDLHQNSASEQKIYEQLDSITNIEFPGNPLTDVIDYISLVHGIPILLDETNLLDEGISPDEEVSLVISGIKLRSALKILLDNVAGVSLAYVIEDEVMKITTQTIADETLSTRVYPVGDLVIPIQPLGGGLGGAGFGGGGILGGGGGGLGGGGFGGGGFGGGGFGGGGGGFGGGGFGGGGFFSVPDPVATQQDCDDGVFDAAAVEQLKKKPNLLN